MKTHYDRNYYKWQNKCGELGALVDLWKFKPFIKPSDSVLDFGCASGDILEKLTCRRKYGIEINDYAIKRAKQKNITVYKTIEEIPKLLKFDVIISHHALEHVENPFLILKELRMLLKNKGTMIFVLPIDDWRIQKKYDKKDINKHLYAWTPLLIGNLFAQAGYKIKDIKIFSHAWIPFSKFFYHFLPNFLYFFLCKIWSITTFNRQMRIIATK